MFQVQAENGNQAQALVKVTERLEALKCDVDDIRQLLEALQGICTFYSSRS